MNNVLLARFSKPCLCAVCERPVTVSVELYMSEELRAVIDVLERRGLMQPEHLRPDLRLAVLGCGADQIDQTVPGTTPAAASLSQRCGAFVSGFSVESLCRIVASLDFRSAEIPDVLTTDQKSQGLALFAELAAAADKMLRAAPPTPTPPPQPLGKIEPLAVPADQAQPGTPPSAPADPAVTEAAPPPADPAPEPPAGA